MFVKAQEITAPQIFYKNHSIALTLGNWARLHKSIYLPDPRYQSSVSVLSVAMWLCCAQLHWHRAIRHCISNEMRYDHLPLAIPAPRRTHHHTTHSYPGTLAGAPDKFRECNFDMWSNHSHWHWDWRLKWKQSMLSVWSSHKSPWSPHTSASVWEEGNTHQFHCF